MGTPAAAAAFLMYSTNLVGENGISPEQFDTTALQGCVFGIRAEEGKVVCKLHVKKEIQNRNGHLHGGCTATIVDIVGTAALLTRSRRAGVSLAINTNYLRPVPGNRVAEIRAKIQRLGRTIGVVEVDIYDSESGQVCASGTHIKFISKQEPDLGQILNPQPHMILEEKSLSKL
jgi:acyl-coenzyme A thioesterase 13